MDWIDLPQGWNKRRALVNTVMKFRNTGHFLTLKYYGFLKKHPAQ
jgi:hypothetical protein